MPQILFVDDDPNVLSALKRQLHTVKTHWSCKFLESAEQALTDIASYRPDVVVTDFMMPGMKGDELAYEIRRRFPKTTPIILSGNCPTSKAVELTRQGIEFLAKPCDSENLMQVIGRAISVRSETESLTIAEYRAPGLSNEDLLETVSLLVRCMAKSGMLDPEVLPSRVRSAFLQVEGQALLGSTVKESQIDLALTEPLDLTDFVALYDDPDNRH